MVRPGECNTSPSPNNISLEWWRTLSVDLLKTSSKRYLTVRTQNNKHLNYIGWNLYIFLLFFFLSFWQIEEKEKELRSKVET